MAKLLKTIVVTVLAVAVAEWKGQSGAAHEQQSRVGVRQSPRKEDANRKTDRRPLEKERSMEKVPTPLKRQGGNVLFEESDMFEEDLESVPAGSKVNDGTPMEKVGKSDGPLFEKRKVTSQRSFRLADAVQGGVTDQEEKIDQEGDEEEDQEEGDEVDQEGGDEVDQEEEDQEVDEEEGDEVDQEEGDEVDQEEEDQEVDDPSQQRGETGHQEFLGASAKYGADDDEDQEGNYEDLDSEKPSKGPSKSKTSRKESTQELKVEKPTGFLASISSAFKAVGDGIAGIFKPKDSDSKRKTGELKTKDYMRE